MALAPGSNAGPYRIVEPLGRGGMASVYKAYEAKLDRYVALKVLPREFLHDPSFAERFREEARLVAKLEHPAIVPIYAYDIDEAEGIPWMAMRLVPGGSLSELIKRERLPLSRSVALLRGVAEALDYAHAMKVVHRDVKPQNVLLDEKARVYLADFGIGRMLESSGGLTGTGMIVGTPQYMAPEQATTSKVGPPADVYALGIVAYEMFTGRVPFAADTPLAVMMKHVQEPLPLPPPELVPEPMLRALLKATSKKPEDRWPTAGAFVDALAAGLAAPTSAATTMGATATLRSVRPGAPTVVSAETARPSPSTAPPAPPRPPVMRPPARDRSEVEPVRRSRWPLLALGGVGIVAALAAAALGLWVGRGGLSPDTDAPLPSPPASTAAPVALGGPAALPSPRAASSEPVVASTRPAPSPAPAAPELAAPAPALATPRPGPSAAPSRPMATPSPGVPATAATPVALPPTPAPTPLPTPAAPAVDPEVQRFTAELASSDTATRRRAAQDLAARGPQSAPATDALVAALRDRSPDVRLRAAEALGRVGSAAAAAASEPLAAALRDTDALVPAEAAKALGLMGAAAAPAAGALGRALAHPQVAVRREAARALARIGRRAEPALEALVEALSDKDKTVCSQAARALGEIGAPARSAVPKLTALTRDADVRVSREAQGALDSIGRDEP